MVAGACAIVVLALLAAVALPATAAADSRPDCAPKGEGAWAHDTGFKRFRIWYRTGFAPGDEPVAKGYLKNRAHTLTKAMDEEIWPRLTDIMNVTPVGEPVDICMVKQESLPKDAGGVTVARGGCDHVPSYIQVPETETLEDAKVTLAHEFMHVLQLSLDVGCANSFWWREATATWAEDAVYPHINSEHGLADVYLKHMDEPLPGKCDPCEDFTNGRDRQYGSYLFPFFLARSIRPELIGTIWHRAQSESILKAIDDEVPDGLKKQWPRFALDAWNKDPVDYFHSWDDLNKGASEYTKDQALGPGSEEPLKGVADLKHLSVKYFNFKVESGVRTLSVTIPAPYSGGVASDKPDPHAKMQAIIELAGGSAEVQDWTDHEFKNYCFALPHQKVTGVTLVFSNSDIKDDFQNTEPGWIVASDVGCKQWTGTISAEIDNPFDVKGLKFTSEAHITYKRLDPTPDGTPFYVPVSGGVNWHGSGTTSDGSTTCTYSESGSWETTKDAGSIIMEWSFHTVPGVFNPRFYSGDLGAPLFYFITGHCSDGTDHTVGATLPAWSMGTTNMSVSANGLTMHGHYGDSDGNGAAETWDWNLRSSG